MVLKSSKLTSWYGKYSIFYRVLAPSLVVGDFETINSTTCFPFPHDFLLPNFRFDHAALHGAGRSLWPTAAPGWTSTKATGPYESITKKKDHPGQTSPLLKLFNLFHKNKVQKQQLLHVRPSKVLTCLHDHGWIEGVPWLATVLNTMEVWASLPNTGMLLDDN